MFYAYLHCKPDGTPFYVGKGNDFRVGLVHRKNAHHKNVVAKYGAKNIRIEKFACTDEQEAFAMEQKVIAILLNLGVKLANRTLGGEGAKGWAPTEETRQRMSEASASRWRDPEYKARALKTFKESSARSEVNAERLASVKEARNKPESKAKTSAALRNLWGKEEYRNKVMASRNANKETEEKKRARIQKSLANRTPEGNAKIAALSKARWADPEYKSRLAESMKRAQTPELKARLSEARKKLWADPIYREKMAARGKRK